MKNESLIIKNLHASFEGKEILRGLDLTVKPGEVHTVMGPNGSGKSTLSSVIMGSPLYDISHSSRIMLGKKNLNGISPDDRAKLGIFLAFQSPVAVPGVSVLSVLRSAYSAIHGATKKIVQHNPVLSGRMVTPSVSFKDFLGIVKHEAKNIGLDESLFTRAIHDGFSGGERKKVEMLTALVLAPKIAVFDEIDTGLDVDALRAVSDGISAMKKGDTGIIVITHYLRILKYVKPDAVHIMVKGKIVQSGSYILAKKIEEKGYGSFI